MLIWSITVMDWMNPSILLILSRLVNFLSKQLEFFKWLLTKITMMLWIYCHCACGFVGSFLGCVWTRFTSCDLWYHLYELWIVNTMPRWRWAILNRPIILSSIFIDLSYILVFDVPSSKRILLIGTLPNLNQYALCKSCREEPITIFKPYS